MTVQIPEKAHIPDSVTKYFGRFTQEMYPFCFFLFHKDGSVRERGGSYDWIGATSSSSRLPEIVSFVQDLLPLHGEEVYLPDVGLLNGAVVDVHLFPGKDGDWAVFRNVTARHQHKKRVQQKLNHLALLQEQGPAGLPRFSTRSSDDALLRTLEIDRSTRASKTCAVLSVQARISFPDDTLMAVDAVFDYVDQILQLVRYQIGRKSGTVIQAKSDSLDAVFELDESPDATVKRAIDSALFIFREIDVFNKISSLANPPSIGVGVAYGNVFVAEPKVGREQEYRVLGDPVTRARYLAAAVSANEAAIGEDAYKQYASNGLIFRKEPLEVPRLGVLNTFRVDYHEHGIYS